MKKLKILLYADSFKDHIFQTAPYYNFFERFGEVILVSTHNDLKFFLEHGDVLALPGGLDVDPTRYGEKPSINGGRINPHYEYLDKYLLSPWLATGKPIIGICRGMQTLNVSLGGTLYPDIDWHLQAQARHVTNEDMTVDVAYIPKDYDQSSIKRGVAHFNINTFHHQAVADIADGFKVIGWGTAFKGCPSSRHPIKPKLRPLLTSDKYGNVSLESKEHYTIVEAMIHNTKPYVAFQYHPEEFDCEFAIHNINQVLKEYYEKDTKKIGGFTGAKEKSSKV